MIVVWLLEFWLELEVLKHICFEKTSPEIAELLDVSKRTVEGHRAKLMQKTQSKNIAGLFRFAMKYKLFADLV